MKLIITTIVATTIMTLFSVLASSLTENQFNEPFILAVLFGNIGQNVLTACQLILGYILHYAIGLAFVLIFVFLWKKFNIRPSFLSGAVFGFVTGIMGIAAWMITFKSHPDPPVINYTLFYAQLLVAHIIFGFTSAITYKSLLSRENKMHPM